MQNTTSADDIGRSTEDLTGAFSLQKTIRLASSSECFFGEATADPLNPPQSHEVNAMKDDQPPGLAGFGFEPRTVYVGSDRAINFTAHFIDDQSGLWASAAYFHSPSGNQTAVVLFRMQDLTSGTTKNGVYASRMSISNGSERGDWQMENITLVDREGNRRVLQREDLMRDGLPTAFQVT
ncbi:MAG: hypothetical protein GYA39_01960 [Methanothrix sp.]|nr:hypothetical protein [Methanothrix sp.]